MVAIVYLSMLSALTEKCDNLIKKARQKAPRHHHHHHHHFCTHLSYVLNNISLLLSSTGRGRKGYNLEEFDGCIKE